MFCAAVALAQPAARPVAPAATLRDGVSAATLRVDEPASATQAQLERVKVQLQQELWGDAIGSLRQVLEQDGSKLVRASDNSWITVREHCHRLIAALPADALALYRQQVDPVAVDWLNEAVATRDEHRLRRIIDELFCSSAGDDALNALAELALEQGDYTLARHCWESISGQLRGLDGSPLWLSLQGAKTDGDWAKVKQALQTRSQPRWLAYPDSHLDLGPVRARLVWVAIAEGSFDRATIELNLLKQLHPGLVGRFAGQNVPLAPTLEKHLREATAGNPIAEATDWPTFAGDTSRTKRSATSLDVAGNAWPQPISWGRPLSVSDETIRRVGLKSSRIAEISDALLSYHPAVVGDLLVVANERQIAAYDVRNGQPAFLQDTPVIYPAGNAAEAFESRIRWSNTLGVPRFTLTVDGSLLFARLGSPVTAHADLGEGSVDRPGHILCIDLAQQGRLIQTIRSESSRWSFEGAPVAADGSFYVVMRYSDVRPQVHVACFETRTGRMRWRQFICASESSGRGMISEATHNLLTLDKSRLYLNTNLGVVAALRTDDGSIDWLRSYERSFATGASRDLNPCVYFGDMLFVAPSDSRSIFALSASTGAQVWRSDLAEDVTHLLGVGGGHLIASGSRLWWFNLHSGKAVARYPARPTPTLSGCGRGVLAGQYVYWPTRNDVLIFGQNPRRDAAVAVQVAQPLSLNQRGINSTSGSNLIVHNDQLLVVTPTGIAALSSVPAGLSSSEPQVGRSVQILADRASHTASLAIDP